MNKYKIPLIPRDPTDHVYKVCLQFDAFYTDVIDMRAFVNVVDKTAKLLNEKYQTLVDTDMINIEDIADVYRDCAETFLDLIQGNFENKHYIGSAYMDIEELIGYIYEEPSTEKIVNFIDDLARLGYLSNSTANKLTEDCYEAREQQNTDEEDESDDNDYDDDRYYDSDIDDWEE